MNTPIDWLRKELEYYREFEEFYTRHYLAIDALFNEAKQKEKEKIEFAYADGFANGYDDGKYDEEPNYIDNEDYYNKTFKI